MNISMDTCFGLYGTTLDIRISSFYLSRVLLGFHHNPKIIKSKVGKILNGIRRMWNSHFEVGFMV